MGSFPPQRHARGSGEPMVNSPPGIQTIPAGAVAGAGVVLGTVGAKPSSARARGTLMSAVRTDEMKTAFHQRMGEFLEWVYDQVSTEAADVNPGFGRARRLLIEARPLNTRKRVPGSR